MGRRAQVRRSQWKVSELCQNCVALFQTHLLTYSVQLQSPRAMSGMVDTLYLCIFRFIMLIKEAGSKTLRLDILSGLLSVDVFSSTRQNRALRDFGSIWAVGLVVQLTSAAVADVAGSHTATTVARQTALRFRHSDEVVTDSGLQAVEPPFAQPFHNSDSRTTP